MYFLKLIWTDVYDVKHYSNECESTALIKKKYHKMLFFSYILYRNSP